ncbi:MAG: diaminobutyrate acetyltransferase [Candidatus Latescibacteria bacterium]|nr:diaminobutyrate acetyltransferase [Candidatus Latescibacterota bacterium]
MPALTLRKPLLRDGAAICWLVKTSQPLERNSCYAYLLLCQHFPDTCVVAEQNGEIVGFLSAYRPPASPEVIFVWQVAVRQEARGRGVATAMLTELLSRRACRDISFLEATISPSNRASQALFRSLARQLETQCEEIPLFAADLFGGEAHEEEILFRIGLFRPLVEPATWNHLHTNQEIARGQTTDL